MTRAVWVDEGNDADYAKLRAHAITAPYFSVRDPRVTKAYLQGVRDEGFTPGIYAAWNWPETGILPPYVGPDKGARFADWVGGELERIASASAPDFPRVQLNAETHDVPYLLAMLKRWRALRPKRVTSWTLEGYQGGLFSAGDVISIAARGVEVVPQAYTGGMEATDAVDVFRNLVSHSFPPALVSMFYDAAQLPEAWSGYAFTMGRLP